MAAVRIALGDVAKALVVLAMCLFLLGAAPADSIGTSITQQAAALGTQATDLCGGGHDQTPIACHAPNSCCRPDQALLPPRQLAPEPAYAVALAVIYPPLPFLTVGAALPSAFRARAPPLG